LLLVGVFVRFSLRHTASDRGLVWAGLTAGRA
jgi:hypothetical protein